MSNIKRKKQIKYESILKVSEELMQNEGLQALNMNDVAKEANLAKGTLYLYFKSREEIIGALALKARILLFETFKEETSKEENSLNKIRAIIRANFIFLRKNKLYYELVSFYENDERSSETTEMREVIEQISRFVESIIIDGQKNLLIKPSIDPVTTSLSIWGMTVGVMQLIKSKAETIKAIPNIDEIQIIDNYADIVLNGIKK